MRTRTVALATSSDWPDLDGDGPALLSAMAAEGLEVAVPVWDDPSVDWSSYDVVVVRTTWDWWSQRDAYVRWCESVPRLLNPAPVLRWNTDKAYLRDLADAGVPVVPTTFLSPGDAFEAPDGDYVVKPTVSAAAEDTARWGPGDSVAAAAQVAALHAAGRDVMVQPYLSGVDVAGETAVLCFDGVVSHGARKGALLERGAGVVQDLMSSASITAREPSAAELEVATQVLAAVPAELTGGEPLLYARVDLVPGPDGSPVLLELEVVEPSLFLFASEGSAARFAAAVARRL